MYLFLFSPNNSGKTVIAQYIAQRFGFYLPPFGNNEGQFAPAVAPMMRERPWDPSRVFDWTFIRATWDDLLLASGADVFVEASPPNILRVREIERAFGEDARFVFSISNPYSFCGSLLFGSGAPVDRQAIVRAANGWLTRARAQKRNIEEHPDAPRSSYEEFCADPQVMERAVTQLMPHVTPSGSSLELTGKAAGYGGIVDLTARNTAFFDIEEIEVINACFEPEQELLDFLGYAPLTRAAFGQLRERNPAQWLQGRQRRGSR